MQEVITNCTKFKFPNLKKRRNLTNIHLIKIIVHNYKTLQLKFKGSY